MNYLLLVIGKYLLGREKKIIKGVLSSNSLTSYSKKNINSSGTLVVFQAYGAHDNITNREKCLRLQLIYTAETG